MTAPANPRAAALVRALDLAPHPEGGFYRELFRSALRVRPEDGRPPRSALTTILFLLADGGFSRWHRVTSDEAWHFHEGDPLELVWLEDGGTREVRAMLGPADGETTPAAVIPAGCWQAARTTGGWSLVGCTVGPGFDFADFTMLSDAPEEEREGIVGLFPWAAGLV